MQMIFSCYLHCEESVGTVFNLSCILFGLPNSDILSWLRLTDRPPRSIQYQNISYLIHHIGTIINTFPLITCCVEKALIWLEK